MMKGLSRHLFRSLSPLLLLLLIPSSWRSVRAQSLAHGAEALAILQQAEARGEALYGLCVWEIGAERPVIDLRSRQPFIPASVTKIFSTGSALLSRGADYRFPTSYGYRGAITSDGVLEGDLIIVGYGDPSLESKYYPERRELLFEQITQSLCAQGIRSIEGRILVDASSYCDEGYLSEWPRGDWGKRYAPMLSGVNIYDNTMQVGISARDVAQGAAIPTFLSPEETGNRWRLDIQLGRRGNSLRISTNGRAEERVLSGQLSRRGKQQQRINIDINRPAETMGYQLRNYLSHRGLTVDQCTIEGYYQQPAPTMTTLLGTYYSPMLASLIRTCNVHSVNLYAESLLRSILSPRGEQSTPAPCTSTAQSTQWVEDYWREACQLDAQELHLVDGSGLSPNNRISPYALTAALRYLYLLPAELSDAFVLSLPQVGLEGTVRTLTRIELLTAYFKSGAIHGVQNFAGYVSYEGRTYCVAIMANELKQRGKVRQTIAEMLTTLFPLTFPTPAL